MTRSTSPDGLVDEADRNGSGLALTLKGDRVLLLDELGYKVEAAPGRRATRLARGLYWITGLTCATDPAFAPRQPDAVLLQQTLNLAF
ncbi:hypothetical protein MTR62_15920 [Novosphingobium sp. 1949]|uniref:Uncharacterized protein n=1 Tax=Novosphingobium organovorum TaxID=2930092 RepID=A0ABT0BGH2_9SPHN|nr:hypothetical protein [Novosphingobium organovorum]MCJ2184167.1 hypothetical protein [Novosphingobium organovorum]